MKCNCLYMSLTYKDRTGIWYTQANIRIRKAPCVLIYNYIGTRICIMQTKHNFFNCLSQVATHDWTLIGNWCSFQLAWSSSGHGARGHCQPTVYDTCVIITNVYTGIHVYYIYYIQTRALVYGIRLKGGGSGCRCGSVGLHVVSSTRLDMRNIIIIEQLR